MIQSAIGRVVSALSSSSTQQVDTGNYDSATKIASLVNGCVESNRVHENRPTTNQTRESTSKLISPMKRKSRSPATSPTRKLQKMSVPPEAIVIDLVSDDETPRSITIKPKVSTPKTRDTLKEDKGCYTSERITQTAYKNTLPRCETLKIPETTPSHPHLGGIPTSFFEVDRESSEEPGDGSLFFRADETVPHTVPVISSKVQARAAQYRRQWQSEAIATSQKLREAALAAKDSTNKDQERAMPSKDEPSRVNIQSTPPVHNSIILSTMLPGSTAQTNGTRHVDFQDHRDIPPTNVAFQVDLGDIGDKICEQGFQDRSETSLAPAKDPPRGWSQALNTQSASKNDNPPCNKDEPNYKRDEELMKLLMQNRESRIKHAKSIGHLPVAVELSNKEISRLRADKGTTQKRPTSLNEFLAKPDNNRFATRRETQPKASIGDWTPSIVNGEALEECNSKDVRDTQSSWAAVGQAVTEAEHHIKEYGLNDSLLKEVKEIRGYEERVSSGKILLLTERRRLRDITKNMKRRETCRLANRTGPASLPSNTLTYGPDKVRNVLNWLRDAGRKSEQASSQLNVKKMKNMDIERQARLGERRQSNAIRSKSNRERKKNRILEQLRLFDDQERTSRPKELDGEESDDDISEPNIPSGSSSSIISDEDEGIYHIPKSQPPTIEVTSKPTEQVLPHRFIGGKGLSKATQEKFQREQAQISAEGFILPASARAKEPPPGRPSTRRTTSGKTLSLGVVQQWMHAMENEDSDSDSGDDDDLWMYQVKLTEHGGATDKGHGSTSDFGSFYTLGEANARAAKACFTVAASAKELLHMTSNVTYDNGVFSQTISYASGRSLRVSVNPVPVQIHEPPLQPQDYRIPSKVYVVYGIILSSPQQPSPQVTHGIYTTAHHANAAASECIVESLISHSSVRHDEAWKATIQMKARQYLREVQAGGGLFATAEDMPSVAEGRVKVWVEECLVGGPRN